MVPARFQSILCFLIIASIICIPAAPIQAGGSFLVEKELMPILDQLPDLKAYLFRNLEIAPSGFATRIGNDVNPKFGGRRIGPYIVKAKPKGIEGPYSMELIIHTQHIFLDSEGFETDVKNANEIREKFMYIEYRPLN